jgi:hypothetical protein
MYDWKGGGASSLHGSNSMSLEVSLRLVKSEVYRASFGLIDASERSLRASSSVRSVCMFLSKRCSGGPRRELLSWIASRGDVPRSNQQQHPIIPR